MGFPKKACTGFSRNLWPILIRIIFHRSLNSRPKRKILIPCCRIKLSKITKNNRESYKLFRLCVRWFLHHRNKKLVFLKLTFKSMFNVLNWGFMNIVYEESEDFLTSNGFLILKWLHEIKFTYYWSLFRENPNRTSIQG